MKADPATSLHSLSEDYASGLFGAQRAPCLSLYQATHRHFPSRRQDPIRFKNLVRALEESLLKWRPNQELDALIAPFRAVAEDEEFWTQTGEGLAVLAAPEFFRAYHLRRAVKDLVVVADTFHTKPLLRILQSADRYQILAITRKHVRLYEGNRDGLDEIEPAPQVPRTITEALGEEHSEPHHAIHTYGTGPARGPAMHHGHGAKKDDVELDAQRFFRAVDRAVFEHHSQPSGLPLLLAALPEHHAIFREVSHNPHLAAEGITVDPESLDIEGLRDRAWKVVLPSYVSRLESMVGEFGAAKANGKGTEDLAEAAKAAAAGRIRTLLVDADQELPGRLDMFSGKIETEDPGTLGADDLLDDIAELVLSKGGTVLVVPHDQMPTETGLAATFFY